MELNLKNLFTKITEKLKKEQEKPLEQQVLLEQQKQENMKKQLEVQLQNVEKAAKLNILDAELSIRNVDALLESGKFNTDDFMNDNERIAEAKMIQTIASEQKAYNINLLLKSSEIEHIEVIDKFSKNSTFASASESLNQGYDNVLGLEKGRRYRVYPNINAVYGIHADSLIIKFQELINGMNKKQAVKTISEITNSQSSAIEFVKLLKKKEILTQNCINEKSTGYEGRMFEIAVECAENISQKYVAEQRKEAEQKGISQEEQKVKEEITENQDKGLLL